MIDFITIKCYSAGGPSQIAVNLPLITRAKHRAKDCCAAARDFDPQPLHKIVIKLQVMPGQQHRCDDLAGFDHMVQIGPAELAAGGAAALRIERRGIFGVPGVLEVQGPIPGEGLAIAA